MLATIAGALSVHVTDVIENNHVGPVTMNSHICSQLILNVSVRWRCLKAPLNVLKFFRCVQVLPVFVSFSSEVTENVSDLARLHCPENTRPDSHDVRVRGQIQDSY